MIEFITDSIKQIMSICIGLVFGFIFGITLSAVGFIKFFSTLPNYMTFIFFIMFACGIFFLFYYFKKEKSIEQIKKK